MFQQEEGQKTQEKETQTTLRLCKKAHTLDCVYRLKAITEHSWHCCKIKKEEVKSRGWCLHMMIFLMMSAMMICEMERLKKGFNQHISSLSSHVGLCGFPFSSVNCLLVVRDHNSYVCMRRSWWCVKDECLTKQIQTKIHCLYFCSFVLPQEEWQRVFPQVSALVSL